MLTYWLKFIVKTTMKYILIQIALIVSLSSVFCAQAYADIGLPMIAIYLPPAWLALIPIILIEAYVGKKMLNLRLKRCILSTAVANIITTIMGIPITWIILAIAEPGSAYGLNTLWRKIFSVTIQSPWLIPYENEFWWMIPAATIVLAFPFYFMSVGIEYAIVKRFFKDVGSKRILTWMWKANALSYLLIICIIIVSLHFNDYLEKAYAVFMPINERLIELVFRIAKILR